MRGVFLPVVLIGAVIILVGMLGLGAFPPKPHPVSVQHSIPVDKLPAPHPAT